MSSMVFYVSSTGERIALDGGGVHIGTANGLRGRKWSYTLGYRSVSGISRDAREVEIDAAFEDMAQADRLRALADHDMRSSAPGYLDVGGRWRQRALIAASEVSTVFCGFVEATLTVLLLDGAWRREAIESFTPVQDSADEYLDYPHDFDYDFGGTHGESALTVDGSAPAPVKLVVYGPAQSVDIGIGANRYQVDAEVPQGSLLVIDGASFPKSITLVGQYGEVSDRFAAGVRGRGEGSGNYVFQPLEPGFQRVSWDRTYGFDLHYYVEEGEPPWS